MPFGRGPCRARCSTRSCQAGFVHGFTLSHSVVGATVGGAVLARLGDLIDRSRELGSGFAWTSSPRWPTPSSVGDVRGLGLMIGVELVRDRETKEPFPRADRVTERVVAAARDAGEAPAVLLHRSA